MIWLSIRLPQLPLEALYIRSNIPIRPDDTTLKTEAVIDKQPVAIIENNQIVCANQNAIDRGIRIGQTLTGAYALCSDIKLLERSLQQEQQKLSNLALVVYAYSPNVVLKNQGLLLVEIAPSLKLYQSLERLLTLLRRDLDDEEVDYCLAIGHTPQSAELLSFKKFQYSFDCWQTVAKTLDIKQLEIQLKNLPVETMNISSKDLLQIHSIGIKNIGNLKKLPEKSINKRFGEKVSQNLQKIFNQLSDPQEYFSPPDFFQQKLEFFDVVHHREGLLFPIKRLAKNLYRFLILQQKNCQFIHWELFDSEKNTIGFDVLLSDSQISEKTYVELTQLNLERYTLHAPIEAISLTANRFNDLNAKNGELFQECGNFKQDAAFINKIRAKLGNNSCYSLQQKAELVPELACRQVTEISSGGYLMVENQDCLTSNQAIGDGETFHTSKNSRPSWLLEKPKPITFNQTKLLWHGELKIISSQERITHYWWKKKVARDYFLAEHDDGTLYWVFYDQLREHWYLHGVYG